MKRFTPEQIVSKLRQADVELGKGQTVPEVCRKIEVSQQTYYRWRQRYGGMSPELIKELKNPSEGEPAASQDHRRSADRHGDHEGGDRVQLKKLVSPVGRRRTVAFLRDRLGYSERRICRAIGPRRRCLPSA